MRTLGSILRAPAAAPRMRLAGLALLALAVTATSGRAHPDPLPYRWDRSRAVQGDLVDVQVLVEGHPAPLFALPGEWQRRYFEASRARNYALRIHNRTGRRVAVLVAVDGLNAVNGARSALARSEPMYVLDPWESATIRGWRISLEQVRQFVFVDEERSYASRTDQANGDMGWIRVLAFEEDRPVVVFQPPGWRRFGQALPREERAEGGQDASRKEKGSPRTQESQAPTAPPGQNEPRSALEGRDEGAFPGTGWGDRRHDPVRETRFDPAARASDHIALRYEYASGLRALGIFTDGNRLDERERGEFGFAPPPRW